MTEKEVIEFDLKCLRNVMNNFEDGLCEKMQEKVDNIKNYLEQKDKEISELKEDNQHQWDERCKLTFAYDKDTHTLQNQLDVANADRVEKDKIIDDLKKEAKRRRALIITSTGEYSKMLHSDIADLLEEKIEEYEGGTNFE